jgi:AcrR family transcriptional regulator
VPRIVDHDERREQIVGAAARVIAREGMEAATVRRIAAEAGHSSGVLDHYFSGKADILLQALQLSHARIRARVLAAMEGHCGLAALRILLLDNLPLDDARLDETRLEMQFWGLSTTDDELRAQQAAMAQELRKAVRKRVREAISAGELREEVDAETASDRLLAFVDGLSVRAVLHPDRFPPNRQRALLDDQLDCLR